ncbi:heterocyst differentiation protein HetZ [Leptolyngbya sp. PCC 6406]|uniref:heterocyst differentiation protein HetZ n=1 Tax=Leptolyngbya sp. PCC 6406 TaxID=1173264 RepID=UPI0002ABADD3|nr:heterocyst differentiation protein HetZ [Leptolyngbya sp. PCC 6406]
MAALSEQLFQELRQATAASERDCRATAERLSQEVQRICNESQRIQDSGDVEGWAMTLGRHRVAQCVKYYRLGSSQGRVELHSTLSAIVYRYITPKSGTVSYQTRLQLIEDFLQGFYGETFKVFRRENVLSPDFQPRTLMELAEYMAFSERYGKRRISLPRGRSQQIVILRAQTFSQQQPPETLVDLEQAMESGNGEADDLRELLPYQRLRESLVTDPDALPEEVLRNRVVEALLAYLKERNQEDCADYFTLRLLDLPTGEIEAILSLTPRQRDYLQQRFKYHLIRFALSHHWELVHEWLEADLHRNLGLTPHQWERLQETLSERQRKLLALKQEGLGESEISQRLGGTVIQVQKQWSKLLEQAWEIRNL